MIPFINALNLRLVAYGAVALIISFAVYVGYNKIYDRGAQSVQLEWDKDKQAREQKLAEVKLKSDRTEFELKTTYEQRQKALNEKIANLNKSLAVAIAGLSNRPARPSDTDMPTNTCTSNGATGAELYRADAEFLIGEATRAEKLRIQLETCQMQYNAVAEALRKAND